MDGTLYQVTDVPADITSDSAAHARDQAIAEAQRSAPEQPVPPVRRQFACRQA